MSNLGVSTGLDMSSLNAKP